MQLEDLKKKIKGTIKEKSNVLNTHATDKSYLPPVTPTLVIAPKSHQDIPLIIDYAVQSKQPITAQGALSGKSGGGIPEKDGIAVSFKDMDKILEIDPQNRCMVVEPGVIVDDIKQKAKKHGLFYPPDPASSDWCSIGGTIAENAGGPSAIKYGVTRDYVLGLKGYFGNGKPFTLGQKCHKDVAGYDLKSLLVGSEGTLGLITEITLKLIPLPPQEFSAWCSFDSIQTASTFLANAIQSNVPLSAAEFIEKRCLKTAQDYLNQSFPWATNNTVLLRYESNEKTLKNLCKEYNGEFNTSSPNDFWIIRRSVSESLAHAYKNKYSEDITLPPASIPDYLNFLSTLETNHIHVLGYGHLGDGNVHTNILNIDLNKTDWETQKKQIIDTIMNYVIKHKGTLSGEHGIGLTKKAYMNDYFSKDELELMNAIKKHCDPHGILNPSKIFS